MLLLLFLFLLLCLLLRLFRLLCGRVLFLILLGGFVIGLLLFFEVVLGLACLLVGIGGVVVEAIKEDGLEQIEEDPVAQKDPAEEEEDTPDAN